LICFFERIRIVDDDIDLKNIEANASDDELYYGTKEEKPMIAAVVDERPLHMRRNDIDTNRWKTIGSNVEEVDNQQINIKDESSQSISKFSKSDKHLSPPKELNKRLRHDSDSDLSPVREVRRDNNSRSQSSKTRRHDSDSDLSPPRTKSRTSNSTKARHDSDSDLSPPRETNTRFKSDDKHYSSKSSNLNSKVGKFENDRDLTPPRNRDKPLSDIVSELKGHYSENDLPPRLQKDDNYSNQKSKDNKKSELTLAGKKSGLSDAKELRNELLSIKKKEQNLFASISDEMLGKNAKTVFRDSKSGKIRDLEEEARLKYREDSIKEKINSEKKAKYEKWSKGLVQTKQQEERLESDLHEMSKPLARYEDDSDLDKFLREREREDDPMLATIRKNRVKQESKDGNETIKVMPTYKGPTPPMNRFKIMPGYRWDAVDRSNGFEKKYFERISNKESALEEAYRWSTQDM
jgi:pre-mRNA-splicing factor CWC26